MCFRIAYFSLYFRLLPKAGNPCAAQTTTRVKPFNSRPYQCETNTTYSHNKTTSSSIHAHRGPVIPDRCPEILKQDTSGKRKIVDCDGALDLSLKRHEREPKFDIDKSFDYDKPLDLSMKTCINDGQRNSFSHSIFTSLDMKSQSISQFHPKMRYKTYHDSGIKNGTQKKLAVTNDPFFSNHMYTCHWFATKGTNMK